MRRPSLVPLALLSLCLASGCMATAQLQELPLDVGARQVFDAPLPETLAAARQGMSDAEISVDSESQLEGGGWMLIGKGPGATVRVVVQGISDTETAVRVYSLVGDRELALYYPEAIFESINSTLGGTSGSRSRQ